MKTLFRRLTVIFTLLCLVATFTVPGFAEDGGTGSSLPEPGNNYENVEPNGPVPELPNVPADPAEPADPADPADPVEPTDPADPADPVVEPGFHYGDDGSVTYYDENGIMVKGWKVIDGKKYYFSTKNGVMAKGLRTLGGKKYYFNKSTGVMYRGWKTIDGKKYYFSKKNGAALKGLYKVGDYKYFFNRTSGRMMTGLVKDAARGRVYNIDSKGRVQRILYCNKKAVALTYDDGPADGTKSIVKVLQDNGAVATFFVVGNRAGTYSDSIKAASRAGNQIGCHTYSHPWLSNLSSSEIKSQMNKCSNAIKRRTGTAPAICRTPGGENSSTIRSSVGMPIILWSIDTRDWATRDANATYNSVISNVSDGDIVLMHDLHDSTAVASKRIIPKLKKMGYQMVTVEELALLKGVKLKAGKVYCSF